MVRAIKVIFAGAIFIFFATSLVYAFKTFYWGGGAIHQEITASGLMSLGVSEKSFKIIDEGNTWQDNPAPTLSTTIGKLFISARHFDDNNISGGFNFVDEQYEYIKKEAANAYKDKKAYENVLYAFGELLHTMQDFYSHTNYVELHLKAKRVESSEIKVVEKTHLPAGLRSGYFYFGSPASNEVTISRDDSCDWVMRDNPGIPPCLKGEEFEKRYNGFAGYISYATDLSISVLHLDMNKDDTDSSAGSIVVPGTGKTIYQYAYNLAVRETTRQWKYLEELIRKTYSADANKIIYALKTGTITKQGEACEGIEIAKVELSALRQKASNVGPSITTLQNAHTQGSKVEAGLAGLSAEIENLRLKSLAFSNDCAKKLAAASSEAQRVQVFLAASGEKASVLRKTADALAITSCELAERARLATEPKKASNHAYNSGQFAKQARKKAEEANALAKQAASMVQQLRGPKDPNAAADELNTELNSLFSRLKEQQAAVMGLLQWQANANLAYSSIQTLSLDAEKASNKVQQILQACPNEASAQAIINEIEKVYSIIQEAHKQAETHYNALAPILQRSAALFSQNASAANALTKNISPCDNLKSLDLSDLLAGVETIEVFAQTASDFAAKAESCAQQAAAISKEREAPTILEMVAQIQSDRNSYYPDETITGVAWVRGGQPPYKSFGRSYGSGKKPEDVISFKWEAPVDAKPEEIGKPKKFVMEVFDATNKMVRSNVIEVMVVAYPAPELRAPEQQEGSSQQSPASEAGDCTSCAYQKCPACADSMMMMCESPNPDCQACSEANCR